jgi:hypothetical protein
MNEWHVEAEDEVGTQIASGGTIERHWYIAPNRY